MKAESIKSKFLKQGMPFEVTPGVVGKVERMIREHKRKTGEVFNLKSRYVREVSRWNACHILIEKFRGIAGLKTQLKRDEVVPHQPCKELFMAIITLAILDLYKDGRKGERQEAMAYFDSPAFDEHCEAIGLEPEWADKMIERFLLELMDAP